MLVISSVECRELLDFGELRESLALALQAVSDGRADVPPRIGAWSEFGVLAAMPGNVVGLGMAAKLVSVFPGNHGGEIPSHQGLIALFDQDDGRPLAMLDGAYITGARTAVSSALAADLAARSDATSMAMIGAGVQGHAHARAFADLRAWSDVRVSSRSTARAQALAETIPGATLAASFEDAVRGADVVALCTDAADPVIERDWVSTGTHVSSVGVGREIDPDTIDSADRIIVEWRGAAANPPPAGAHELQGLDPADLIEVGEVIGGRVRARVSGSEITVYKSTGHAAEDIAAARVVCERAVATGAGTRIAL
jgi:alanine dehydrogenase